MVAVNPLVVVSPLVAVNPLVVVCLIVVVLYRNSDVSKLKITIRCLEAPDT